jgi:hypothetical protein
MIHNKHLNLEVDVFLSKVVANQDVVSLSSFCWLLRFCCCEWWCFYQKNYNLQVMICVLCHSIMVNVNVHSLAHGKNMKRFINYNKYQNISFFKNHVS